MRGLRALVKKELQEQLRTYKLVVIAAVFLLFGMSTPLMFHYLPDIIEATGELDVEVPVFTAQDVFSEYADSFSQIVMVVVILVGMGAIARERERGTAAMTLCKPVGRGAFLLAKFLVLGAIVVVMLQVAGLACWGYTLYLFDEEIDTAAFFALNILLALYLLVVVAVALFYSSLFRNQLAAGGVAFLSLILLWILSAVPWVGDYAPVRLVEWGRELVSGASSPAWPAVAVSVGLIAGCLVLSWAVLRRKEL